MKKISYSLYLFLALALIACEEQTMNKTDLGSVTADGIWEVPAFIKAFVDNTMRTRPDDGAHMPGGERGLMYHCEESYNNSVTEAVYDNYQVDNPDGGLTWGNVDRWSYVAIRKTNVFLDNRDNFTPSLPEKDKQDYIGQMLVARAWMYFDMVRVYGGVPLLLHAQRADEELAVPRSKTSECIAQIISDLDEAIAIPDEYFPVAKRGEADFGRINKAVAYALKGRILLTYASPQFSSRTPAGTKPATERWAEAYAACREAKERLETAGYGLFRPNPANAGEAAQNYYDLFHGNEMNEEMVWVRRHKENVANFSIDKDMRPASSYGNSYFMTLEFANAFGNADGTPYTGLALDYGRDAGKTLGDVVYNGNTPDGVTNVAYWQNREPRFYANVGYNGSHWPLIRQGQNRMPDDVADGMLQHQWIFKQSNVDFPFDQADNSTNSRGQGLLIRKFVDRTRDYSRTGEQCGTDWPLVRYAEVLLNYAEAAAMTGRPAEAYEVLDAIRRRAGIPQGSNNYGIGRPAGNELLAAILHERAVELAFESFRFYDVRRHRQFTDDLVPGTTSLYGSKLNGLRRHTVKAALLKDGALLNDKLEAVNAILAKGELKDSREATDEYFKQFKHEVMLYDIEPLKYNPDREDFLRIPYSHIKSNPTLEQTIGWTDDRGPGTFDPYE